MNSKRTEVQELAFYSAQLECINSKPFFFIFACNLLIFSVYVHAILHLNAAWQIPIFPWNCWWQRHSIENPLKLSNCSIVWWPCSLVTTTVNRHQKHCTFTKFVSKMQRGKRRRNKREFSHLFYTHCEPYIDRDWSRFKYRVQAVYICVRVSVHVMSGLVNMRCNRNMQHTHKCNRTRNEIGCYVPCKRYLSWVVHKPSLFA